MNNIESKIRTWIKSITWLNLKTDHELFQGVIHFFMTWALTVSFGIIVGFVFPLLKEFIYDGHWNFWRETPEERKDLLTDLITNGLGFIIGVIIVY